MMFRAASYLESAARDYVGVKRRVRSFRSCDRYGVRAVMRLPSRVGVALLKFNSR